MKKLAFLGFALFAIVACQQVTGTLTVKKSFGVQTANKGAVTMPAGTYNVRLKFEGSKVRVTDGNGIDFKMQLPASLTRSGKFPAGKSVSAQELGQSFGMSFAEKSTLVDVYERMEQVTCALSQWDRNCRPGDRFCSDSPWGTARALVEISTFDIARGIKFIQGQNSIANFSSMERATQRRVLRQGPCRPDRYGNGWNWDPNPGFSY